MSQRKPYWELLRDPRWQKKRLEAMQRAGFECEECGDKESTLNVHHKLYRKGAMPWEYADRELQVLCEQCHKSHHELHSILQEAISMLAPEAIHRLIGYAYGLTALDKMSPGEEQRPDDFKPDMQLSFASEMYSAGFLDAFWIDYWQQKLEEVVAVGHITVGELWRLHCEATSDRVRRMRAKGMGI